jgi:5-methylthioadenosine/S-adenosylhomocysteine deaminase
VLVDETGRIVAVGPDETVPSPPGVPSERFEDAVLLPGLVNAHTHLELTGLGGAVVEGSFPEWIRRLRQVKAERTPAEFLAAAKQGVRDCWAAGVTTVADTGDTGAVIEALAELGGRGVCYHEVFGPHPGQVEESMEGLRSRVAELRRFTSDRVRLGVSPHAPYTVSRALYREVAAWARSEGLPLAVHLAESPEESALVGQGSGPFAEMWRRREIPVHAGEGRTPVEWVDELGVLHDDTLCIHMVQANESDLRLVAMREAAIAHCPLSNHAHAQGTAPLAAIRQHGIRVGLGTDSVVSVGTLDLLAEARAARAVAGLGAACALELATVDAANAIGWSDAIGALRPGRHGDMALFSCTTADPVEAALAAPPHSLLTVVDGRAVHRFGGDRLLSTRQ